VGWVSLSKWKTIRIGTSPSNFWVPCMLSSLEVHDVNNDTFYYPYKENSMNWTLVPLTTCLVSPLTWTFLGVKSPENLTRMPFGMRFLRIIGTIQVHARAPLLGILLFGWPNACFHVVSLLGTTTWMSLDYLSYTFCIVWWMANGLTLGLSWPINCIV